MGFYEYVLVVFLIIVGFSFLFNRKTEKKPQVTGGNLRFRSSRSELASPACQEESTIIEPLRSEMKREVENIEQLPYSCPWTIVVNVVSSKNYRTERTSR